MDMDAMPGKNTWNPFKGWDLVPGSHGIDAGESPTWFEPNFGAGLWENMGLNSKGSFGNNMAALFGSMSFPGNMDVVKNPYDTELSIYVKVDPSSTTDVAHVSDTKVKVKNGQKHSLDLDLEFPFGYNSTVYP
jgi:hypothetical protein